MKARKRTYRVKRLASQLKSSKGNKMESQSATIASSGKMEKETKDFGKLVWKCEIKDCDFFSEKRPDRDKHMVEAHKMGKPCGYSMCGEWFGLSITENERKYDHLEKVHGIKKTKPIQVPKEKPKRARKQKPKEA